LARLDWEKANRRERRRKTGDQRTPKKNATKQKAIATFVATHEIGCFVCGDTHAEWAKSGINARGPWAICLPCVQAST
jgi:hypothetical protein